MQSLCVRGATLPWLGLGKALRAAQRTLRRLLKRAVWFLSSGFNLVLHSLQGLTLSLLRGSAQALRRLHALV